MTRKYFLLQDYKLLGKWKTLNIYLKKAVLKKFGSFSTWVTKANGNYSAFFIVLLLST